MTREDYLRWVNTKPKANRRALQKFAHRFPPEVKARSEGTFKSRTPAEVDRIAAREVRLIEEYEYAQRQFGKTDIDRRDTVDMGRKMRMRYDTLPSWDNVVRAYEEDR